MWTIANDKTWDNVSRQYDWVADMHGVQQDAVHHAEGDVAIHTNMVLQSLVQMQEYNNLDAEHKEVLWAATLLHDVEKRSTTVLEEDGSITSKGHAKKGAITARQILYRDIATPFDIREQIVNLVRYHGLPLWAIEKKDTSKAVIEASMVCDTRLLATLATADATGRICTDKEDLFYRIELFKGLCIENECWGSAKLFKTAGAKFAYFNKEDAYADYVPYDDFGSQVVLMSGLPGAGKDTYVRRHYKDWNVINLDEIRRTLHISPTDKSGNGKVVQYAKEQAKAYLRKGAHFVWNATNITTSMRSQLVELFTSYKAHVTIVYVEVPYRSLHQQNSGREHMVPKAVVDKLVAKLEVPKPWEAHEIIYRV
jgi:putative nucleotidyltransferase with HDIG domain